MLKQLRAPVALLSGLAAPFIASAQSTGTTFDPSSSVASINGTIPGMLAVGGAVFLVVLAIKSTKWARRAL